MWFGSQSMLSSTGNKENNTDQSNPCRSGNEWVVWPRKNTEQNWWPRKIQHVLISLEDRLVILLNEWFASQKIRSIDRFEEDAECRQWVSLGLAFHYLGRGHILDVSAVSWYSRCMGTGEFIHCLGRGPIRDGSATCWRWTSLLGDTAPILCLWRCK